MTTVSALFCYPVKGFAAVALDRAEVSVTGVVGDRALMVVSAEDGVFLSQRVLPAMATVRPEFVDGGLRLTRGGSSTEVRVVLDGPRRQVSLFKHWFGEAVDQGEDAARWCSEALGRQVRLVGVAPEHDRDGWGEHPGKIGFSDAHALSMISESSLDALNERIAGSGGRPVPMDRFRPNVVVSGWAEPHTEDTVRELGIGTADLGFSTKAIRCAVPTVDQRTGERDGPEPTRTLASYRREPDFGGGVSFGAKLAVLTPGTIAVGDRVRVRRWAAG
ncbi:MOSC domain-containing protein [Actinokineospora pegani]|uniref:MOSC domain-containing protein n=1 Tax=Actinokineospora pegani TaxID=2654637 RepID=UPI001F4213D2|nr:MOSC N-terminal beta barrel domain-containing protein [Actinokineospora pegani]